MMAYKYKTIGLRKDELFETAMGPHLILDILDLSFYYSI